MSRILHLGIQLGWKAFFCSVVFIGPAYGEGLKGVIPDEYESEAGHTLGLGNAGVAAVVGQSSVKTNPAMLSLEKKYEMSAAYHWPTYGRGFYQAGIIDSTTSKVAAGLTYTDSTSGFELPNTGRTKDHIYDSPVKRRLLVGLGQSFAQFSLGIGAGVHEIKVDSKTTRRRITLNLGGVVMLSPELRLALSVENIANKDFANYAPTTYRAGAAYTMLKGAITLHLDYKQRERVLSEYLTLESNDIDFTKAIGGLAKQPSHEKMVTASGSVRVQDLLRVLAAFGQEIGGQTRQSVSGGIALVNNNVSLSYLISNPYLSDNKFHHGINLSFLMSM